MADEETHVTARSAEEEARCRSTFEEEKQCGWRAFIGSFRRELRMMRESAPVAMTTPTTQPLLRRLAPRSSTFSIDSGWLPETRSPCPRLAAGGAGEGEAPWARRRAPCRGLGSEAAAAAAAAARGDGGGSAEPPSAVAEGERGTRCPEEDRRRMSTSTL